MAEKNVYIKLLKNGESKILSSDASAPIILGESKATILNVEFPKCFIEENFSFKCFVGETVIEEDIKNRDKEKSVIKFVLPKIDKKNTVLGFCAYQESNKEILKYVKWQSVQCTCIGG